MDQPFDGDGCHVTGFRFVLDENTGLVHTYACETEGCESFIKMSRVRVVERGRVTCLVCLKQMRQLPGALH
jgi:hypothetical protein